MPRAPQEPTKYPGVYKRKINDGRGKPVYDYTYRDEQGKQRWVKGKYTNLEEAQRARISTLAQVKLGVSMDGTRTTFEDFAENVWLPAVEARVREGRLRSSSLANYRRDVKNHLIPRFGKSPLAQINNAVQVEELRDALLDAGRSPDTARRVMNTLGYVLTHARRRRLVSYNPVEDAEKPSPRRRQVELPTIEQLYALADSVKRLSDRNLILFAAFTGLRISEVFGLAWSSVSLAEDDEHVLVVQQYYKGELVSRAKTKAGNRQVTLGVEAADLLKQQTALQQIDSQPNAHALVFPAPEGGYWRDSNFNRRVWQRARATAGLPGLTFHGLRYFYTSHLRSLDLPSAVTHQLVGHTDEKTHQGYTRPIPGYEKVIRQALDGAFARPEEK